MRKWGKTQPCVKTPLLGSICMRGGEEGFSRVNIQSESRLLMGVVAVGPCCGSRWEVARCSQMPVDATTPGAWCHCTHRGEKCNVLSFPCCFPHPLAPRSPASRLRYLLPSAQPSWEWVQIKTEALGALKCLRGGRGCCTRPCMPGVVLQMTQQCRKETSCWWNRPLPLLHPICAPCLSNSIQNRRKIWTPHSL